MIHIIAPKFKILSIIHPSDPLKGIDRNDPFWTIALDDTQEASRLLYTYSEIMQ